MKELKLLRNPDFKMANEFIKGSSVVVSLSHFSPITPCNPKPPLMIRRLGTSQPYTKPD